MEQLKIIANPKFDEKQMTEVHSGYINGLKPNQVAFYAKPEIPFWRMYYIRLGFENGVSLRKIYFYSGVGKKFGDNALKEVYECFLQGVSIEEVKVLVDVSTQSYDTHLIYRNIQMAKEIVRSGCSLQDLQEISNTSSIPKDMTFEYVLKGLKNNISIENIKYYVTTGIYYFSKIDEIISGFKHGLTQEQVKLFARNDFGDGTMRIVRLCLEYGMSIQQVQTMIENEQFSEMKAFIEAKVDKKTEETDLYGLISGFLN